MTADTRPNIIFIVVDDCGYADLGCTGQTHYATPALDRMAAEGVRFTQAYANASLCTNTRVALMTGRYQYRCNLGLVEPLRWVQREMPEMGLPPEVPTLPGMLRAAGYATALIGKWHLGYLPRYSPLRSGYDAFFGIMGGFAGYYTHIGDSGERDLFEGETPVEKIGYVTDLISERALAHVRAAQAGAQPYFLSLHYTAPHWPWSAPSNEAEARARELDRNQLVDGGSIRIYAEMMEILDRGIGAVLEAVRAGSGRETLVLFTSDNGGERYSKIWPFVGRKFDLLEGGLRVPQIAWWPGRIAPGWVSDQVTITMDLTATCLEAGGARIDPAWPLDGESLLPHLIAGAPPRERTLYWRMANRAQRALRRGDMKYLKVNAQEFLFDLGFDERERDNLAAKQPGLLAELRAAWEAWDATMLPLKDFGPVSSPSRMGDMLW
jgi:arylsulfatase A-like enzyme